MRCPNCGNEVPDEYQFCTKCGTNLAAARAAMAEAERQEREAAEQRQREEAERQAREAAAQQQEEAERQAREAAARQQSAEVGQQDTAAQQEAGAADLAGTAVQAAPQPAYQSQQQTYQQPVAYQIPKEFKPISMWGYFGYELLFAIPVVGFILLIVFSFGGTENRNLKNFARSYFCLLVICVILAVILGVGVGGAGLFEYFKYLKH